MLDYEKNIQNYKNLLIAGCDEAGRGPSAGPLYIAACIMPIDYQNEKINDSKKLSEKTREKLFDEIINNAISYSIIKISANEVDALNPKQASRLGMKMAIEALSIKPDLVITDFEKIDINITQINLIKGDEKSLNVAAASILAKVSRDRYMIELAKQYPQYDFENNKGYFTKKHAEAIAQHGICLEHRKSYKNIKPFIK
ncbi:ribonuclease HII [Metamycoplasma neophronis]|uniref:Ribonuclease HII n=1 Tax=Metamycoplasma neophronis TaxID=872983 RepID=A0ABY2Z1G1_9BACT|nr:ribonuclease HII [Metamycoplasma neophronis]TPR54652.1 ribonuclease HII [Metamycoplasma neophronis]